MSKEKEYNVMTPEEFEWEIIKLKAKYEAKEITKDELEKKSVELGVKYICQEKSKEEFVRTQEEEFYKNFI